MSPAIMEKNTSLFKQATQAPSHISVSEFARGKGWRDDFNKHGCIELTDRSGPVGLLLTPECAESISFYIMQLEEELEQTRIEKLFELRSDYASPERGEELLDSAMKRLEELEPKVREFLDGD